MNDVGPHPVDDRPPDEDAAGLAPGKEIRSAETTDSGRRNVIHVEILTALLPLGPDAAGLAAGGEAEGWNVKISQLRPYG